MADGLDRTLYQQAQTWATTQALAAYPDTSHEAERTQRSLLGLEKKGKMTGYPALVGVEGVEAVQDKAHWNPKLVIFLEVLFFSSAEETKRSY